MIFTPGWVESTWDVSLLVSALWAQYQRREDEAADSDAPSAKLSFSHAEKINLALYWDLWRITAQTYALPLDGEETCRPTSRVLTNQEEFDASTTIYGTIIPTYSGEAVKVVFAHSGQNGQEKNAAHLYLKKMLLLTDDGGWFSKKCGDSGRKWWESLWL